MTQTEAKVEVEGNGKTADDQITTAEEVSPMEEKLVNQIEFYFGDVNLPHDKFIKLESANHEGWFPAELLLKFNKLKEIVASVPQEDKLRTITDAIQRSVLVEVSEDGTKIRRNPEMPVPEGNKEAHTIYLKGFNKTDTKIDTLIEYFKKYDGMEAVVMRYYKEKLLVPPKKASAETAADAKAEPESSSEVKTEKSVAVAATEDVKPAEIAPKSDHSTGDSSIIWVKKFKGSIFVVFKTEEQARAALADITTYAGHPLMKMMQTDYYAMKKREYQARMELRNSSKKRKGDGDEELSNKKLKTEGNDDDAEKAETLKGVLIKISEIPDGTTREVIKEAFLKAVEDKEKFQIGFVDFQRGDTEGVMRLTNEGAATEAMATESLKEGTLKINDESFVKLALFDNEEEEKTYILKMQQDRLNFQQKNRGGGGGRGGGRGRGRGRGRSRGRGRRH